MLATLIDAYESEHFPIDPPDLIEAIKFRVEQQGLTRRDLEAILGTRARVAEILNRKRDLSIGMIRRLHERLGISAEVLIRRSARPPLENAGLKSSLAEAIVPFASSKGSHMTVSFDDLKARLLANPKVKMEYDALAPEFEISAELVKARLRAGLSQAELAARMGATDPPSRGWRTGRPCRARRRSCASPRRPAANFNFAFRQLEEWRNHMINP